MLQNGPLAMPKMDSPGENNPSSPSTFMGCPSSQGFIAHNVKVSVQSQCKMHQENHCRIRFLHRQCADQKYETSAKMQTVLIFEDASVRVYEDDPPL